MGTLIAVNRNVNMVVVFPVLYADVPWRRLQHCSWKVGIWW